MNHTNFGGVVIPKGPIELIGIDNGSIEVPAPPPTPPALNPNEAKFTAPKVVENLTSEEDELPSIDDLSKSANSQFKDTSSYVEIKIEPEKKDIPNEIYESFAIQEQPIFQDGISSLIKFVAEQTKYPVQAQERNIEGTVYIRFVVTKTGDVSDARVLRGVDPLLDDEALRVVRIIPKWTPGKNNGNPVSVYFIIPVKFKLQ
jgi:protein TonB